MAKEHILVVEDEEDILELVRYNLAQEGYQVAAVTTAEEGLRLMEGALPDLIVLDLMLPGMDGLEACRIIKSNARLEHIPIVILTARGGEVDVVTGLELGADDYIVKPFSPRVVIARIRAVLRRQSKATVAEDAPVKIDKLFIHPGRREVRIDDVRVDLTFTEFQLLLFLAKRPGWVYTRYQIVNAIKGEDYPVTDRSVDVQVAGLRKKLGEYGEYIETVRSVGYRFREKP